MARRKFPRKTFTEINVTPLIDTLFFLLIIFMLIAPLLETAVEVSPPRMNATEIKPDPDAKIVNVRADGSIQFDHREVTPEELVQALRAIPKTPPLPPVYLRADGKLLYEKVIDVMKMIRSSGFPDVLLVMGEEE